MCGIAGWYGAADRATRVPDLQRMLAAMVHRGPDDEGTYLDPHVALGIRRLSIIDVEGGHQPICNEDGSVWTVLNGEIYNYRELRAELEGKGHRFKTRTDTEVLVHGYEEWGDDVVVHLNGIFGLAIWDQRLQRLLLARDPYGVKPLYYRDADDMLLWASEVKALLASSAVRREVDLHALDLFLTFRFVPSPHTLFRGICKLRPGHRLVRDAGGTRIDRYSRPAPRLEVTRSDADWVALLQERLEAAVKRQMVSDVPIGALLSGGIDSAAIVAIMTRMTDRPVSTFTVGFKDALDVSELAEARATAAHFRTEHHEIELDALDYQTLLEKAAWHLEEPVATSSSLAMYLVCQLARRHVTVVLTGQGADEPHCGYQRYIGERYGAVYRAVPPGARSLLGSLVEALPRQERLKRAARSLGTEETSARFAQVYALFSAEAKQSLWRDDVRPPAARGEEVIDYWRRGIENLDPLVQMTQVDTRLSLADDLLMYGDKMSMAASVEARVPFLDLEYMAVAESLPPWTRVRRLSGKYLHRRALSRWLPDWILRRRKRGFETPIDRWFRDELSGHVRETLLASDSACLAYFDRSRLETLLDEHARGRQDHRRQLFALLAFELWHRQFIRGGSS